MFFHLVHVLRIHSEEESLKKETVENIRYFDMQKLSSWGYNMERKLKTYKIHLKVNGPVFVGDGNEIQKKEYMFLLAEFDNFRKRTLKEKSELIKNAAEGAMKDLLPVLDDFERAIQATSESNDVESIKEGVNLIYNKFVKYLEQKGVKAIESQDADFDTEYHEAVTTFPTDDESKKGKVIDTVQKGYVMNDKVIRHSKVVVGQ